jgi:hypothetical protein
MGKYLGNFKLYGFILWPWIKNRKYRAISLAGFVFGGLQQSPALQAITQIAPKTKGINRKLCGTGDNIGCVCLLKKRFSFLNWNAWYRW